MAHGQFNRALLRIELIDLQIGLRDWLVNQREKEGILLWN